MLTINTEAGPVRCYRMNTEDTTRVEYYCYFDSINKWETLFVAPGNSHEEQLQPLIMNVFAPFQQACVDELEIEPTEFSGIPLQNPA